MLSLLWGDSPRAAGAEADARIVRLSNPYADVDWERGPWRKINLHTHTTRSDGKMKPEEVIEAYRALGYAALAITDHDLASEPWETYGMDAAAIGMTAIPGNELSHGHDILSLFCAFESQVENEAERLRGVQEAGGLAIFAHPGRYRRPATWYAALYRAFPNAIGQEIHNQGDRYPQDRSKWDEVLMLLMPDRPVWGFSNDDAHTPEHIGRNRTYVLVDAVDAHSIREALKRGRFCAAWSPTSEAEPPRLLRVTVSTESLAIEISAREATEIRWISNGAIVAVGDRLRVPAVKELGRYVRVELHGPGGITYLNPFGLHRAHPATDGAAGDAGTEDAAR